MSGDAKSDAEVLRLVEELRDLRLSNVCFTGGEPLLRKDVLLR